MMSGTEQGLETGAAHLFQLYRYAVLAYSCELCRNRGRCNSVERRGGHCGCILRRLTALEQPKLPLTVVDLSSERIEDNVIDWNGFSTARELLRGYFELRTRTATHYSRELLQGADICFVNPVSAVEPLSDAEIEELVRFSESGGTVLLNVFSQWNRSQTDLNQRLGTAFGVLPEPFGNFGPLRNQPLHPNTPPLEALNGPFGHVRHHVNLGSTPYQIIEGEPESGPARGGGSIIELDRFLHYRSSARSGLQEPGRQAVGGQLLICSNFHWFADEFAWNGGCVAGSISL